MIRTAKIRSTTTAVAVAVGLSLSGTPAGAAPTPEQSGVHIFATPPPCAPAATSNFTFDVHDDGSMHLTYPDDGFDTCNEALVIESWTSDGVTTAMHAAPPIGQSVLWIADLEAAGTTGVGTQVAMDPCFTAITMLRDGDSPIYDERFGDGCEMTIDVDFVGRGHSTDIHVVQQTGPILPPHIFDVHSDTTTVLTGLPNGTWYVKVYDGWTSGSSIQVVGEAAHQTATVHGVTDGAHVDVTLAAPMVSSLVAPIPPRLIPIIPSVIPAGPADPIAPFPGTEGRGNAATGGSRTATGP